MTQTTLSKIALSTIATLALGTSLQAFDAGIYECNVGITIKLKTNNTIKLSGIGIGTNGRSGAWASAKNNKNEALIFSSEGRIKLTDTDGQIVLSFHGYDYKQDDLEDAGEWAKYCTKKGSKTQKTQKTEDTPSSYQTRQESTGLSVFEDQFIGITSETDFCTVEVNNNKVITGENCKVSTNSKNVEIVCLNDKSMCKTSSELIEYWDANIKDVEVNYGPPAGVDTSDPADAQSSDDKIKELEKQLKIAKMEAELAALKK